MNNHLWDHLLPAALAIEALTGVKGCTLADIKAHMETIEVTYDREFDPADCYAEYVAVTLCRAINRALQES